MQNLIRQNISRKILVKKFNFRDLARKTLAELKCSKNNMHLLFWFCRILLNGTEKWQIFIMFARMMAGCFLPILRPDSDFLGRPRIRAQLVRLYPFEGIWLIIWRRFYRTYPLLYHKFGNMVIFRSGNFYSLFSAGNQHYQKIIYFF